MEVLTMRTGRKSPNSGSVQHGAAASSVKPLLAPLLLNAFIALTQEAPSAIYKQKERSRKREATLRKIQRAPWRG